MINRIIFTGKRTMNFKDSLVRRDSTKQYKIHQADTPIKCTANDGMAEWRGISGYYLSEILSYRSNQFIAGIFVLLSAIFNSTSYNWSLAHKRKGQARLIFKYQILYQNIHLHFHYLMQILYLPAIRDYLSFLLCASSSIIDEATSKHIQYLQNIRSINCP